MIPPPPLSSPTRGEGKTTSRRYCSDDVDQPEQDQHRRSETEQYERDEERENGRPSVDGRPEEGMQLVPLQMARLAKRLDPARPRYAVHLASLLDDNGHVADAEILRGRLRAYWQEYERLHTPETPAVADSLQLIRLPFDLTSSLAVPFGLLSPTGALQSSDSLSTRADTTASQLQQ